MSGSARSTRRLAPVCAAIVAVLAAAACAAGGSGSDPGPSSSSAAPGGTHRHAAAPPPAAPLRAGERFVQLTMPHAYTPTGVNGGTDEYRCFVVDPGITTWSYLTGSQFLPQNLDIVHHAIFFRVGPGAAEEAAAADAGAPGPGWTCFGNAGIGDSGAWVAHWAPGANEVLLKEGLGYPMPPGSKLVMQVHYNLLATGGQPGGSDQSGIRLRLADDVGADIKPLETALLAAPVELPCLPAESGPLCDRAAAIRDVSQRFGDQAERGVAELAEYCGHGLPPVAGATQRCDHPVPAAGVVYAVAGHMHLLGRSISIELNPGTSAARTLLDLPTYSFDEQAIRPLPELVDVKPGDTLRVTCTHDAGLRRRLPQLRDVPARYVVWGEGTSDEMCLGLVVWSH